MSVPAWKRSGSRLDVLYNTWCRNWYIDGHNQYGDIGGIVSYHNGARADALSKLMVRDSYFKGKYTVRLSWYGTSTDISKGYVTGCSLGAVPVVNAEASSATTENVEIIAWNNEIRA